MKNPSRPRRPSSGNKGGRKNTGAYAGGNTGGQVRGHTSNRQSDRNTSKPEFSKPSFSQAPKAPRSGFIVRANKSERMPSGARQPDGAIQPQKQPQKPIKPFLSKSGYATPVSKPNPSTRPAVAPIVPLYPMRINKYIALKYNLTRRAADLLIEKNQVTLNDKTAVLGDKISEKDTVTLDTKDVQKIKHTYMYFAYNKPTGVVTHSPTGKETDIKTALLKESSIAPHVTKLLFPIGRLDKKSDGLIILTNDGRLSEKLLNPDYVHEKEYIVVVNQKLPSNFQARMEKPVNIGDYVTKPSKVEVLGPKTFSIVLTEGKKHQIRRMCEVMHTDVQELKRIRIMNIHLASLKPNEARKIEGKPLTDFLKSLKLD